MHINTDGIEPNSGLVNAMAVDPTNSNVVYLAAAGGGVWKTTDGGQAWTPLTDNQPSLEIDSLALDPLNPDVVYAGTDMGFFGSDGEGILKSTDGGATWQQLQGPLPFGPGLEASILSLAVSPSDDKVVLAVAGSAGGRALYRSADGGHTWDQVLAPSANAGLQVLFDPTNGSIAYASLDTAYKSTDGGNTWATANGTGSNVLPTGTLLWLGIAPSNPFTLYAGGEPSSGANMYKSVDGGDNWTPLYGSPWCGDVVVDPTDANVVFAGAAGLERSTDGGSTWTLLDAGGGGYHGGLAFSADGSLLYLGSEWGVWVASNVTNSGWTRTSLNGSLATSLMQGVAIHPTDPTIAFAGTANNGVAMFSGALAWQSVACDNGGPDFAFDFMTPSTIYIACASPPGIEESTDGGANFTEVTNGIGASELASGILAMAMDPVNSQRLYLAANHVWQSNDGANTWASISPALGHGIYGQVLAVAPTDSNTVYLGNSNGVYVTTNALAGTGATWSAADAGLPNNVVQCNYFGPTCAYLNQIALDPSSASTAYAVYASYVTGHVFKTTDRGATWTDISGNLPNLKVNDIAVDPDVPNTLYIATEQGVYVTSDGGNTWNRLGTGLPNVAVSALKLHRPTRILRAATYGRSAWDLQLAAAASPVALSAAGLSFANQAPAQTVTLTNSGTAPLTLYSVTAPNGFSQANTCGIQVASGASCTLTISFVANTAGSYSGNITLSDDAPGEPQLIAVTGTGGGSPDFALYVPAGSSSSATVSPGQIASYTLSLSPLGGFNQSVSLSCTGAPAEATCSVSPASATLDGSDSQTLTVTVATTAASLLPPGGEHSSPLQQGPGKWPMEFCLFMLGLAAVVATWSAAAKLPPYRRRELALPHSKAVTLTVILLLMLLWASCGGGGGGGGGGNHGTPAGTYSLTVSGTYTSGSTALTHHVTLTLTVE
jgi:photosystem II stability/assembly factor-like uncharacterized protein